MLLTLNFKFFRGIALLLCVLPTLLHADKTNEASIVAKDPCWHDGALETNHGAIFRLGQLYVQADHVSFKEGRLAATGHLLILYDKVLMKARRFEYHLTTKQGTIFDGVVVVEPWFLEAKRISFNQNRTYAMKNAKISSCPCGDDPISLHARHLCFKNRWLHSESMSLKLFGKPIFAFPHFEMDVTNWREKSPIELTFGWGGFLGSIIGLKYRFIDEEHATAAIEGLYACGKGPGLALHTALEGEGHCFQTHNFALRERIFGENGLHLRYFTHGHYDGSFLNKQLTTHLQYDVRSDSQIQKDFSSKFVYFTDPAATHASLRFQDCHKIAFLKAQVRVNPFQTVNQQLPNWEMSWRPYHIGALGVIGQTRFQVAFLRFVYSNLTSDLPGYDSSRLEWLQSLYRSFTTPWGRSTPKLTLSTRFYGNSPLNKPMFQANAGFELRNESNFYRIYEGCKHRIRPFCNYHLLSSNFQSIFDQYIFSLQDAYHHLQYVSVGCSNYFSNPIGLKQMWLECDLWCNIFVNMHTQEQSIPKLYSRWKVYPTPYLFCEAEIIWNRETNAFDYSTARALWTIHRNMAWNVEWRFRGPRNWRKADPLNFVLESAESEDFLLTTELSDPHNVFQTNFFWRFHPDWQWQFQLRSCWHRPAKNNFVEFQNTLTRYIGGHWYVQFSHEHLTDQERYNFKVKLGA